MRIIININKEQSFIQQFIKAINQLVSDFFGLPFFVVHRTHVSRLQPPGDAVQVKPVVASSPYRLAILFGLVGLTLDALFLDVVPADGAVVSLDVPRPQCNSSPLLHSETLLGCC